MVIYHGYNHGYYTMVIMVITMVIKNHGNKKPWLNHGYNHG